jgi:hypothetical protein
MGGGSTPAGRQYLNPRACLWIAGDCWQVPALLGIDRIPTSSE